MPICHFNPLLSPPSVSSHPPHHMGMRQQQQQQQAPPMTTPPHPPQHHPQPATNQLLESANTERAGGPTPPTTTTQSPRPADAQTIVDSWEDIDDEAPTADRQSQPSLASTESRLPSAKETVAGKSENGTQESTDNTERPELKLQSATEAGTSATAATTTATATSSSSSSSSSSSKKQPSPNLTKAPKGEVPQPPQRSEDDKENLNVIFIGHVGKPGGWLCRASGQWL